MTNHFHTRFYSDGIKWDRYFKILRFPHWTWQDGRKFWQEDVKSVWISRQDVFKILQPFWTSGCRRSHCFVQRKGHFPTIHTQETQNFRHQNLQTMWRNWIHLWNDSLFFAWRVRKFHIQILVNDILETTVHVGRQEQHSTKFGPFRSVTVTQPKCRVWTAASGGKRNVFSEVWWTYDVCGCVIRWCSWHYQTKPQHQKFWDWNFLCKYGARNRNVSKINWKLWKF